MRTNANKKIHRMKRDPYRTLLRLTGILAVAAVVCLGVYYLCTLSIRSEYDSQRTALAQQNADAELEFNARMNTLRSNSAAVIDPDTGEITTKERRFWEKELDGAAWRVEDEGYTGLENYSVVTMDRAALMNGGMLLVNQWHSLPSDFSNEGLVSVGNASNWKVSVRDGNVRLFPVAFDALQSMIFAAADAGNKYYIVQEGFRTNDEQQALFNSEMEKLSGRYSGDTLIEQTKKSVNYPGTSEYQTGMSFTLRLDGKEDPSLLKVGFQSTEQGAWITNNSWKYGIVLRFPAAEFPNRNWEDKSYKTGVTIKLNLYRYVGKAHAAAMRIMDYCLEEYVEFLMNNPHITIYEDGALKYEILRIAGAQGQTYELPVPNPASDYIASLDNMDGIVLAYTYNN